METGWTIETLKELLEEKIAAIDDKIMARDKALELQATENKRRLDELNHEHARVAQAQETYVSKDTWEGYVKGDQLWKATADRAMQLALPRPEFQAYKDTTEKALTLKAGQSQGFGMSAAAVFQIISSIASLGAIIGIVVVLTRGH